MYLRDFFALNPSATVVYAPSAFPPVWSPHSAFNKLGVTELRRVRSICLLGVQVAVEGEGRLRYR